MEFGLKGVHMVRYELILKLDGALWLTIISEAPLTPKRVHGNTDNLKRIQNSSTEKGCATINKSSGVWPPALGRQYWLVEADSAHAPTVYDVS